MTYYAAVGVSHRHLGELFCFSQNFHEIAEINLKQLSEYKKKEVKTDVPILFMLPV